MASAAVKGGVWALLMSRLGVRDVIPMIIQYMGPSQRHIYCWKFEEDSTVKRKKREKRPTNHTLYRWLPGGEEFKDRKTVINDSKQGRCHPWIVEDDDRERLVFFQDNAVIIRDLKEPDRSCTLANPPAHPIGLYGARARIDRFIYFLYGGWGNCKFSSFDLASLQFRQLRMPTNHQSPFQAYGSHLISMHSALWHLNDQSYTDKRTDNHLPFLQRYDPITDQWDDEKTILQLPDLAHRKEYACAPFPFIQEGSFLVIGGQGRVPGDYRSLAECSLVTVARDGKSVHVKAFPPLAQAGHNLIIHNVQEALYVTCIQPDYCVCVQRMIADNSWTIVQTVASLEFCACLT